MTSDVEIDAEDGGVLDPEDRLLQAADDALFGMHGATEGSTQWRIESLQLVNWGGFDGHHPVPLHTDATLLTGASGVGKSSLLDAWTALVMPSDTRLNGASNDMTVGRARSQGQRSPLSYVRGVVDQTQDAAGGQARTVSLRGSDSDTWGAVAATFVDDHDRRFTALRLYYAPRRATRTAELVMRLATHDGALDLQELEPAVASRFQPRDLRALVPGITCHDTYAAFATRLFTRLGIGANGDGDKALRLLARIQASQPVRSVDELYKEMVLERPSTYAAADRAVAHFDELEGSYDEMLVAQQKADLLDPITGHHERWAAATERIDQLDAYGATREGATPLRLWELRRRRTVLEAASAANRAARQTNQQRRADLQRRASDLASEVATARAAHREAGGESLDLLDAEREREQGRTAELTQRRDALAHDVASLGVDLTDRAAVEAAQTEGARFLEAWPARAQELADELSRIADERAPLASRRNELRLDRGSLDGRHGRVPRALHEMRTLLAEVAGMTPDELPFLAELIDVPPHEDGWRTAVETVLGGAARQLLVPQDRLREFSAAIDRVRLPRRITFIGAELGIAPPGAGDADRVAGKVDYKEGPFEGWVRWYVADPARNALCVETSDELDGPGLRVTRNGQTRSGNRGSHGRNDSADIIGFSNASAVAAIDAELAEIDAAWERLATQQDELGARRADAEELRDAHRALARVPFADIDVASSVARCDELAAQREALLAADDRLRALAEQIDAAERRHLAAQVEVATAVTEQKGLEAEQSRLVDAEDDVAERVDAIERTHTVVLTDEQVERLEAEFAAAVGPGDPDALDQLDHNLARLRARMTESTRESREQVAVAASELHRIFGQFKERWPDPNLGVSLASYDDYAAILAEIRHTGLAARRAEWQRRLADWSGQDLVPLSQSMSAAVEEIEDRLEPINDILRRLPFGDGSHRLRIRMRRVPPAEVGIFRRELAELSAGAVETLTADAVEKRFARLQAFMAPLRRRDDPRATADSRRDLLLDVRRHVEVSAEKYDPADGRHLAWYRTLGEKSGGESQELIAFVIGAALRFRLGDELRSRPRFAPVFLDEGFVKADAEFAGRAVQAWRGLGFQLIVGAPFDKFTGLERHMDEFLEVVKNPETQRARLRRIRAA